MTYEELLARALSKVPNDIDKREGSVIYNALAPACFELAQCYIQYEIVMNRTFADTSTEEDLTRRCNERGIYRKSATYALRKALFNADVPIGSRFRLEDTTYKVSKKIDTGQYELQCEQSGAIGNVYTGVLLPIGYIDGLETAVLEDILVPGEDEESDQSLRKRYFDSLESDAFGGNIADYIDKTNKLNGVGGTKVYPVWNGGGTVKLVIIDSDYNVPSPTLIDLVQTAIDPIPNQGQGVGIAPIGHYVTVVGVSEIEINIISQITLQEGYTWEDVQPNFETKIDEYLKELRADWDKANNIVVRISYIETRALSVTGILDIQNTLLNGVAQNLVLGADDVPVLGGVTQS